MPAPAKTPDALFLPETLKQGARSIDRINSILDLAEPILGLDPTKGEKGYVRRQPGGRLFVTPSHDCSIMYPTGSPKEGQERYNWVPSPDNPEISFGYLKDKAEKPAPAGDAVVTPAPLDGTATLGEASHAG